jgi:hypothetical protein
VRDFLGVKPGDKLRIDIKKPTARKPAEAALIKEPSSEDILEDLWSGLSAQTMAKIKANAGKSTNQMRSEYMESQAGKREIGEKYGL